MNPKLELLNLLATRLERLSVDSILARRASGLRGSILKLLQEASVHQIDDSHIDLLIDHAFTILQLAAREIPADKSPG